MDNVIDDITEMLEFFFFAQRQNNFSLKLNAISLLAAFRVTRLLLNSHPPPSIMVISRPIFPSSQVFFFLPARRLRSVRVESVFSGQYST